jgi:hypothetical protein
VIFVEWVAVVLIMWLKVVAIVAIYVANHTHAMLLVDRGPSGTLGDSIKSSNIVRIAQRGSTDHFDDDDSERATVPTPFTVARSDAVESERALLNDLGVFYGIESEGKRLLSLLL